MDARACCGCTQDGRLRVDDRLLEVNGVSLLGQSNIDAMETLRHAMHAGAGPEPGAISIAVARSTASPADAVALATPCLRHVTSSHLQSRGLMPPPSSTKVLSSTRKPPPPPARVRFVSSISCQSLKCQVSM